MSWDTECERELQFDRLKNAPKHLNCDLKIISIAAFIATGVFNEGYSSIFKMMNELDRMLRMPTFCGHVQSTAHIAAGASPAEQH